MPPMPQKYLSASAAAAGKSSVVASMPPRPSSLMSAPRRLTSLQRILERQRAGHDERRVLAEAVTRAERGTHAVADEAAKRLEARDLVGQQRGLREAGLVELVARIAERELGHVVTDDGARARVEVLGDRKLGDEVRAHPPVLRPLPGEDVQNLLVGHA